MDTAQFPPGVMLDDKYRIEQLLSVGGMGAVYVGTHTLLKKRVAIKVLRTELVGAVGMVERFQREAVAASAIGHENIVTVTDMGKTEGGVAFLVMELLEGRSLAQAIREDGPLPIGIAADIATEILAGVTAAHRVGIVHRDLKPENVFLVRRAGRGEAVKILDFGISSLAGVEKPEMRLTHTGVIMGTPNYMAPEQARGDKDITQAADIYSTGVILYEMLTQHIPYEAENYNLTVFRVLSGEYVRPRLRRPDLPPALEDTICRAMALNPWDRWASAEDFMNALAPFRSGTASAIVRIPTGQRRVSAGGAAQLAHSDTLAASASEMAGATQQTGRRSSSKKWLMGAVAIALVAGGIGAAVAVSSGREETITATSTSPSTSTSTTGSGHANANANATPAPQPAPPQPAAPSPSASPSPTEVTLELEVTPKTATVTVDGTPVADGRITVPIGATPLAVRASADGYTTYEGTVVPDRSKAIVLPPLVKKRTGRGDRDRGDRDRDRDRNKGGKIVTDDPYGP